MSRNDQGLAELKRWFKFLRDHKLSELSIEEPGFKISLKVGRPSAARRPARPDAAQPALAEAAQAGLEAIRSPLIGIFYRAPSPGDRPFVEEGDLVEEGQVVGIVEAMKVFNEITSHLTGLVREIAAKDSQLVQHGEPLIWLEIEPEG